jgi:hypothetical protein
MFLPIERTRGENQRRDPLTWGRKSPREDFGKKPGNAIFLLSGKRRRVIGNTLKSMLITLKYIMTAKSININRATINYCDILCVVDIVPLFSFTRT